jgi:GNAT superfamily N-acetyltransferase
MSKLNDVQGALRYKIVGARRQDPAALPAVELAAAVLLRGHAPESVLNEAASEEEFREAQAEGRLWVALDGDTPVGFAHAQLLGPHEAHLKEIDVLPEHGRRGLGTRLVASVCDWAARRGYAEVTLTTFRDVPWNMPFYARLGFEVVATSELSAQLARTVADETRRGLDPARRVVMRRRILKVASNA